MLGADRLRMLRDFAALCRSVQGVSYKEKENIISLIRKSNPESTLL